ncbi:hypothetical protein HYV89_00630 [Candidatus Woesearchaeota archaeon]|nr:hypothetical protein [Candidatus Woesearchaeota archaeon]
MTARHTYFGPRNGRNCAPYKAKIESRYKVTDNGRRDTFLFYFYEDEKEVWNGHIDENGSIVMFSPLEVKLGEDPDKILPGKRVLLMTSNGRWKTSESYLRRQAEVGNIRMDQGALDYRKNGYIYELVEKINSHPWSPKKCRKSTELWYPKNIMRFEEYDARARAEGNCSSNIL